MRHWLYDEFEKENYSFMRIRANGQLIPKVVNNTNLDDYCLINMTMMVNGQPQVVPGPDCSEKTIKMLQRFVDVLASNNWEFIDYDYTTGDKGD